MCLKSAITKIKIGSFLEKHQEIINPSKKISNTLPEKHAIKITQAYYGKTVQKKVSDEMNNLHLKLVENKTSLL